jgi:hypothetical protein
MGAKIRQHFEISVGKGVMVVLVDGRWGGKLSN